MSVYGCECHYIFKYVIVGDSSVGKSSLLVRFTDNYFQESWLPTIGVDFKIRNFEMNGKSIKANIWDTAGQERFKNITRVYYKGAHSAILVYDITDKQTFENIRQWYNEVKEMAGDNVKYVLVGNKNDLEQKRQVTYEQGAQLASTMNMKFFETSAKTAEAVDSVFMDIAKELLQQFNERSEIINEKYNKNILKKPQKNLNLKIPDDKIKKSLCIC